MCAVKGFRALGFSAKLIAAGTVLKLNFCNLKKKHTLILCTQRAYTYLKIDLRTQIVSTLERCSMPRISHAHTIRAILSSTLVPRARESFKLPKKHSYITNICVCVFVCAYKQTCYRTATIVCIYTWNARVSHILYNQKVHTCI